MFSVVIQLLYVIDPPGRSLGVDALAWRRERASCSAPISQSLKSRRLKDSKNWHFGLVDTALIRKNRTRNSLLAWV